MSSVTLALHELLKCFGLSYFTIQLLFITKTGLCHVIMPDMYVYLGYLIVYEDNYMFVLSSC